MNVGIFTDTYFPQLSGVATSIETLRKQLEANGHQVYIFTSTDPNAPEKGDEPNVYRFASLPFMGFKERRIAYRGAIQAQLIAKKLKLDIVHTQTEFSLGLIGKSVARAMHIPVVHTYHTNYEDYTHYVFNGRIIRPGGVAMIMRGYSRGLTGLVAPSEQTREQLLEYGIKAPIEIIPTGVKVQHTTDEDQSVALRQSLGLAPDALVMLSLGRIAFEKNIEAVLETFADILDDLPEARLIIAGDGPAEQAIQDHAAALEIMDKVIFTGYVSHDKAYSYYCLADVFVSASESETQGLTYIEAMTANTPVVAINSPYLDTVVTDENIGTLVRNVYELTAPVEKYLLAAQAQQVLGNPDIRETILHEIDERTFGARIIAFYQEAIAVYHEEEDLEAAEDADAEYARTFVLRNPFRRNHNA
ncbi:glycosyltransferase family 4 protein [Weissella diestrammenae]|uniref:Glycosyltransferase family 4 protein n=1 Tax=Weissella diestrammenae TaxID=1162633 RepID=A0A7G9T425_9LACO|nr:glycosyltransferase family 4 protein [Weissella diestrammenae]MCM0583049.1 glycosyltransferase family 4 protein [Weissella diestrammenae]QNN74850.1 glycosyltransferase family 4 protein [Weissella diestrammenae]